MIDYRIGDVRDRVLDIGDETVSLIATSPPFVHLRSYLPADHPDKRAEIGAEPHPAAFLDTLLALTAEWGRVLHPWGSIAIELGDTYAGSGGAGGDYRPGGLREGAPSFVGSAKIARNGRRAPGGQPYTDAFKGGGLGGSGWPRPKCLALIPQLYATSLAYGINILTGDESPAGQWLVRNVIVWHRPNPAPGALGDKYRPSTSYITVATRSPRRYFDLAAVRTPWTPESLANIGISTLSRKDAAAPIGAQTHRPQNSATHVDTHGGAPPLDAWTDHHDAWTFPTSGSPLAHYAMWPARLAERIVLSMSPREVCSICHEPRRRIETAEYIPHGDPDRQHAEARAVASTDGTGVHGSAQAMPLGRATKIPTTIGWTDCRHDAYRPGLVLDPFAGTGTTLVVADIHGRDAIGIDIDDRNRALLDARRDEIKRSLYGTVPELPGQLDLFDYQESET